jgi:hypothetical protein
MKSVIAIQGYSLFHRMVILPDFIRDSSFSQHVLGSGFYERAYSSADGDI